jgi:transcriptional regulator
LEELTNQNEAAFAEKWQVSDAPDEFTEKLIGAVVGIEIQITNLLGKWKVSQNQPSENQVSVVKSLNQVGTTDATAMAGLVQMGVKNEN